MRLVRSSSLIKTGTRRIIRLDELSYVVRLQRRTTEHSSSRRITRPEPVFSTSLHWQNYEKHYRRNYTCSPKFVSDGLCVSSIETTIGAASRERTLISLAQVNFHPHAYLSKWCPGPRVEPNVTGLDAPLKHVSVHCSLVPVSPENLQDNRSENHR